MTKNLTIIFSALIIFSLIFSTVALAKDFELPETGITPDNPFYFLKTWKESIQLFFTFDLENKAKQYLHLAGVRLAEYQKMIEKGKTEIAEKTLTKYQNQLNRALEKANELKQQGKDIKDLTQEISQIIPQSLEILQNVLQKVPEQAQKGIENAIENSRKYLEKISGAENKIIIKQSGGAAMLIAECGDKNYVTKIADYIIEGTVEKVESRYNEGETSIFTYSDLLIERYIKGEPFAENKIQIITPGGTVGEITLWVEDQPIFHEGKKVRVYFKKVNDEFQIICGATGVEEILTEKLCTLEAKICPDGSAVGRTGPNCEFASCPGETPTCKNLCGDGTCQEIVCMAIGCPCPETKESCPQDCAKKLGD